MQALGVVDLFIARDRVAHYLATARVQDRGQIQFHGELADLALKGCDLGFVLRADRRLRLFGAEPSSVVLRQQS